MVDNTEEEYDKNSAEFSEMPNMVMVVVGMEVWFCSNVKPGGYKYTVIVVDGFSRMTWLYGMNATTCDNVCDAFWGFSVEASCFPRVIQCSLDTELLRGSALGLLASYGFCFSTDLRSMSRRVFAVRDHNTEEELDDSDDAIYFWQFPSLEKTTWDQQKKDKEWEEEKQQLMDEYDAELEEYLRTSDTVIIV